MVQPLKYKAKQIFSGLYSTYDWVLEYFTLFQDRYWKRRLLEEASISPGNLILDVGCGTGVLEECIDALGATFVGLDLTKEMMRIAQTKRIGCLDDLVLGDAEQLPFATESFDKVLSCYVIKYCNSRNFVGQIYRVLKPGGRVVLYDFARPHGLFAPFHFFYVYGALRLFGLLTRKYDRGMSFTLSELPKIISRTRWNQELELALTDQGFQYSSSRLSGGAVVLFWAMKPMRKYDSVVPDHKGN